MSSNIQNLLISDPGMEQLVTGGSFALYPPKQWAPISSSYVSGDSNLEGKKGDSPVEGFQSIPDDFKEEKSDVPSRNPDYNDISFPRR